MLLRKRFVGLPITLLTRVTLLGAIVPARAQGQIPAQLPDLKGREISIVTANDYVPLVFIDEKSKKGAGFEYELWAEICLRLNCKLNWQAAAWDGMITAINQKQFDVGIDGISITEERAKQVDFSKPYLTVIEKFLVRVDESRFKTKQEFIDNKALKIGAQLNTTGYYVSTDMLGEKSDRIVLYDDFGVSVQALLKGDVDAIITDVAAGRGFIGANAGKLKLLDEELSKDSLGAMFPKGSDLVAPVNAAIDAMSYDGYLSYLENKWFFLYDPNKK